MTTQIVPSSGQGALFTQQGPGTTPGYSALDDRRSNYGSLQEGVYGTPTLVTAGGVAGIGSADFLVTQRAAGANMSVDVNMPAGGFGYVQGDTINGQGLYTVPVHSSNINEAIAGSDATNPRIDQIILEVQDNVLDASGGNQARTRVLTGTPTVGATLTNRLGALALPGSALLLADVLVPAASSSVPTSNINDRRTWARNSRAVNISTSGTRTNTAYGFLNDANDQVTGIVLPTNGIIRVWYQATWQESVISTASAAIFLGVNQLVAALASLAAPGAQSAQIGTATTNHFLTTASIGLISSSGATAYTGDVTTGQAIGGYESSATSNFTIGASPLSAQIQGGSCDIFAAAGTYTLSVQFKSSSGTVTVTNRKLWVQVIPFA